MHLDVDVYRVVTRLTIFTYIHTYLHTYILQAYIHTYTSASTRILAVEWVRLQFGVLSLPDGEPFVPWGA